MVKERNATKERKSAAKENTTKKERGGESTLVVVESPTKSRKISSILGKGYRVVATFGHIRDLPQKTMGFSFSDVLQGEPKINWVETKRKVINFLKGEVKRAKDVVIATDPDREGEAIGWHVANALGIKNPKRAVFHQITPSAVKKAIASPRKIDMNLVSAQITRRLIDRIVGYTLSPLFWRIRKNSSAGRVQSATLHLIVKRWKEVKDFERKPYFLVFLDFGDFIAYLYERYTDLDGKEKVRVKRFGKEQDAKEIVEKVKEIFVSGYERGVEAKSPQPPYTTSHMLQDAKNILRFSSDFTMKVAQSLFENGLITYHRTDSVSLSEEGFSLAQNFFVGNELSDISSVPRRWRTRVANAQEAHEAIRPTEEGMKKFMELWSSGLGLKDLKTAKLSHYDKLLFMIGVRFIASQSKNALYDYVILEFSSPQLPKNLFFRTKVKKMKFDGFLRILKRGEKGEGDSGRKEAGELQEDERKVSEDVESEKAYSFAVGLERGKRFFVKPTSSPQHSTIRQYPTIRYRKEYTQPPPLYTEATLIREMEKLGIGRPSTYSTIINTLKRRGYVIEEKGKLIPSPEGIFQDEVLERNFPDICSPEFTAKMEGELDSIARGEKIWREALQSMAKKYLDEFEAFKQKFRDVVSSVSKELGYIPSYESGEKESGARGTKSSVRRRRRSSAKVRASRRKLYSRKKKK